MDAEPVVDRASPMVDSLVELAFAVHDVLTHASAAFGLSVTQLRLLGIVRDRTPPMTAIARHLGLDRSSVTGLVDRAERRDLVSRVTSTDDARVTLVRIAPEGVAVGRLVATRVTAEMEGLVARVPPSDRDSIMRVAMSVLEVQAERRPAGTPSRPG